MPAYREMLKLTNFIDFANLGLKLSISKLVPLCKISKISLLEAILVKKRSAKRPCSKFRTRFHPAFSCKVFYA